MLLVERQFQTRLNSTLFLGCAIIMALLATQSYRYGLYNLVYGGSLLCIVFLSTGLYARFAPEAKYYKLVCFSAVIFSYLLVLFFSFENSAEIKHWLFPITLLSYLALPLSQSNKSSIVVGFIFTLIMLSNQSAESALAFSASYALFVGLASTYAQLHKKRSRTLVELEIHDPLTRAYNFRHLEDTLKKEICRSDRTGRPLSLIALEIDYLPQIQDTHGVNVTQELQLRVAETLRAMIRAGDSDYFDAKQTSFLLLPCTPSEGVLVIAERIRRTIEESTWPSVDSITVSLGCTAYLPSESAGNFEANAKKLINDANVALVEAQKNGHNRVCLHSH